MKIRLPETPCNTCKSQIPGGRWFCPICGRGRRFGAKQWELALIVIMGAVFLTLMNTIITQAISTLAARSPEVAIASPSPVLIVNSPTATNPPEPTPTPSPTPSPIPTPTSPPTFSLSNPEKFIRYYFSAVTNQRNYEYTWTLMTDNFKGRNTPNGYNEYIKFWYSVDRVNIKSIKFYEKGETSVKCRAQLVMIINGKNYPVNAKYYLIFNSNRNTWIFD